MGSSFPSKWRTGTITKYMFMHIMLLSNKHAPAYSATIHIHRNLQVTLCILYVSVYVCDVIFFTPVRADEFWTYLPPVFVGRDYNHNASPLSHAVCSVPVQVNGTCENYHQQMSHLTYVTDSSSMHMHNLCRICLCNVGERASSSVTPASTRAKSRELGLIPSFISIMWPRNHSFTFSASF